MKALLPDVVSESVAAFVQQALDSTIFARGWRNKVYAHHDLDVASERNPRALDPGNITKVELALTAIGNAMNSVERHFEIGPIAYNVHFGAVFGAECLLVYLEEGLEATETRSPMDPPRVLKYL